MKRGEAEYRVRWRRGPAYLGWKVRLFQTHEAALKFKTFLSRPNPTFHREVGFGVFEDEPVVPIIECYIQWRPVGAWRLHDGE